MKEQEMLHQVAKRLLLILGLIGVLGIIYAGAFIIPGRKTFEKKDGPTPNGGAYSIIHYMDDQGNPVIKNRAVKVEIIEYNLNGEGINRTYGSVK